jgi:ribonuclease BN (tRNA processing enzyme)
LAVRTPAYVASLRTTRHEGDVQRLISGGLQDRYRGAEKFDQVGRGADININVTEMRDGAVAEGEGWRIRAIEVVHWPIPLSLGFLVEGDGKRVFSPATRPCDAVRNGAAGVDVLIHEAMYFAPDSGHYRSHSHPLHVGEVARQAGASQLVLTHLQPDTKKERLLNDANKEFTRHIVMATDQMRLVI